MIRPISDRKCLHVWNRRASRLLGMSLAAVLSGYHAFAQSTVGLTGHLKQQEVERLLREESLKSERVQREAVQREQQVRSEQRRQTQRALEIESSNTRARRAMEALTGEGYRSEKRAPMERVERIVPTEKRAGSGDRPQNGGGNDKRKGIDLSSSSMFERNGRFQEGSLVQREIEKALRARTETVNRNSSGSEHGKTPTSTKLENTSRPVERRPQRPSERPVERVPRPPLKQHQ